MTYKTNFNNLWIDTITALWWNVWKYCKERNWIYSIYFPYKCIFFNAEIVIKRVGTQLIQQKKKKRTICCTIENCIENISKGMWIDYLCTNINSMTSDTLNNALFINIPQAVNTLSSVNARRRNIVCKTYERYKKSCLWIIDTFDIILYRGLYSHHNNGQMFQHFIFNEERYGIFYRSFPIQRKPLLLSVRWLRLASSLFRKREGTLLLNRIMLVDLFWDVLSHPAGWSEGTDTAADDLFIRIIRCGVLFQNLALLKQDSIMTDLPIDPF